MVLQGVDPDSLARTKKKKKVPTGTPMHMAEYPLVQFKQASMSQA